MLQPLKPKALRPGDAVSVVSLASPVREDRLQKGCDEIRSLGYVPKFDRERALARESFFAGSSADRTAAFRDALADHEIRAIVCARGGYGANYLLECLRDASPAPKILLGASDITSLLIFLWQKFHWTTFYGPMVASNFDRGAGREHGYDRASLISALTETHRGWEINLQGEALVSGVADGILLGGCLTLVETTLGTPWDLDTAGAILVLEDVAMKPYQVDRALMHLKQAGKFRNLAGVILGDFPQCDAPAGGETVHDVARRILSPLGIPVVWGAPIGHTPRPMLTLPLGIRAQLSSSGSGSLRIREPACTP